MKDLTDDERPALQCYQISFAQTSYLQTERKKEKRNSPRQAKLTGSNVNPQDAGDELREGLY
jgi:hypothetical protein